MLGRAVLVVMLASPWLCDEANRSTAPCRPAWGGQAPTEVDGLKDYAQLIDAKSYLDYSAILEAAVDVMANEPILRERLAAQVRYVIVDEYQDVNPIQELPHGR